VDGESVISGIDWLPTLCGIAGVGLDGADFDGEDVSACWLGGEQRRGKPLFWKTSAPGSPAGIREGRWKLIHPTRSRGEVELYDLSADPAESHNVATRHPEVVERLGERVRSWTGTLPEEYLKASGAED
jgi:N-acetylgalactosamine-6-sulfatase